MADLQVRMLYLSLLRMELSLLTRVLSLLFCNNLAFSLVVRLLTLQRRVLSLLR